MSEANIIKPYLKLSGLEPLTIRPEGIGAAYEGLLKQKDSYLGVVVKWK